MSGAAETLLKATVAMLQSRNRGKECLEQMRRVYRLFMQDDTLLSANADAALQTSTLQQNLAEVRALLSRSVQDPKAPKKLISLFTTLLALTSRNEIGLVKGLDLKQTFEAPLAAQLSPLLLLHVPGGEATMRKNVQNIVAWSGEEGVPLLVTQSAFRCMVALAREQRWMLQYATHVKPFEHNLMRVMVRATKFSKAHKASSGGATGFFKLSASQVETPTTELDGRPTGAADLFTALSHSLCYADDQLLNVQAFCLVRHWLFWMYGKPPTAQEELLTRKLDPALRDCVVDYCVRVLAQSKLVAVDDPNVRFTIHNPNAVPVAVSEALRTLDVLCTLDATLTARLVPVVKALPVTLDALEFLLHHSATFGTDSSAMFQAYFTSLFQVTDALAAHELVAFCVRNKTALATKTSLFLTHFPPLLKALAWHPLAVLDGVCELLPLMISPDTYLELLHSVIDLPLMAAAMEESGGGTRRDVDDAPPSSSSAMPSTPSTERLMSPLSLLTSPGGGGGGGDDDAGDVSPRPSARDGDAPPREDAFHVLYNYMLRNESGIALNLWDGEATFAVLNMFCNSVQAGVRVRETARVAPLLLESLCDALLVSGADAQMEPLLHVLIRRMDQLFPLPEFQQHVRSVLENKVMAVFHRCPAFATQLQPLMVAALRGPVSELTVVVCWVIGEYAQPGCNYHEPLELIVYERLSMAKLGIAEISETRAQITAANTGDDAVFASRLLLVIVGCLTKLASRDQTLAGRVVLCLSKVLHYESYFVPAVAQRARQCIRLLREPAVAALLASQPLSQAVPLSMAVRPITSNPNARPIYSLSASE